MAELTLVEAINDAFHTELGRDESVLVMGEDVGRAGGVFRATAGLRDKFGADRCVDTPLAEAGILGTAVGLCMAGWRPVCEMQYDAFSYPCLDQLITHVGRYRWRTRGGMEFPLVVRMPYGGRGRTRGRGFDRGARHPHAEAAGRGRAAGVGCEDRPRGDRPGGAAHGRLRRRAGGDSRREGDARPARAGDPGDWIRRPLSVLADRGRVHAVRRAGRRGGPQDARVLIGERLRLWLERGGARHFPPEPATAGPAPLEGPPPRGVPIAGATCLSGQVPDHPVVS